MSILIGGTIFEDCNRGLTPVEKLILVALGSAADGEGVIRGASGMVQDLARQALCSRADVDLAVRRFRNAGVIAPGPENGAWRLDMGRAIEIHGPARG